MWLSLWLWLWYAYISSEMICMALHCTALNGMKWNEINLFDTSSSLLLLLLRACIRTQDITNNKVSFSYQQYAISRCERNQILVKKGETELSPYCYSFYLLYCRSFLLLPILLFIYYGSRIKWPLFLFFSNWVLWLKLR